MHRIALFLAFASEVRYRYRNHSPERVWRSKLHSDGTSIDGWFVMGIGTDPGRQITYHLPMASWDSASFATDRERAPEFDGHTSMDVLKRLEQYL
jgi:hypothetical protein